MAEEATTTTMPTETPAPAAAAENVVELSSEAAIPKEDEEIAGKQATTEVNPPDGEGTTEVAVGASDAATADATPASGKKEKRKSTGGVPEHKSKKLQRKKSMPTLHLECKPGDLYWARLKGYPPWPAIVCDEQMLPESLLGSRPVSTARPDGTLRDDFKEGGKNAKERTFPIMFLATYEFCWMINTSLTPLDPEECKAKPKAKLPKSLQAAYDLAGEDHDLDFYKGVLATWQTEMQAIEKEKAERQAEEARLAEEQAALDAENATKEGEEEAKPKKKKAPRKSKGGDEDVEMEDAEAPKSSKKRKKDLESDAEGAKPKKTPKVTKLNGPKTPNGEASENKKSTSKPKKKVAPPKEEEEEQRPQMSEEEKYQQREKAILYLRHRLQKGFLSRDQAPLESEMPAMADFFSQLESYESLEPSIIRVTKIHKVLKAIVKLSSVPKDEEYNFKKRSAAMLEVWNKRLESDGGEGGASGDKDDKEDAKAPATNGDAKADALAVAEAKQDLATKEGAEVEKAADDAHEKLDEKLAEQEGESSKAVAEPREAPVEKADLGNDAKDEATDGDAAMADAKTADVV